LLRRVVWYKFTDVSEVLAAAFISALMMEAANPADSHLHELRMFDNKKMRLFGPERGS
jgi:hypothetical protein